MSPSIRTVAASVASVLWLASAGAQRADDAPAMRGSVYERLTEAQHCAGADDLECARRNVDGVLAREDLSGYERAVAAQFSAYVYFEQDRTEDALAAYETLLDQPGVPDGLRRDALHTASQLYMVQGRPEQSLETLDQWFETAEDPSARQHAFRAQVLYELERWAEGKESIDEALRLADAAGHRPDESWHLLAAVLDFEVGGCEHAADEFEALVRRWPTRKHYLQAAGCAGAAGDTARRLELMDVASAMGLLGARDSFNHAVLLLDAQRFDDARRAIVQGNRLLAGAVAQDARGDFDDALASIDAERYDDTLKALIQGLEGLSAARD